MPASLRRCIWLDRSFPVAGYEEELVDRVLVLGLPPRLNEPVIADMGYEDALVLEGSSLALATGGVESNGVLIVREDVVELNPECAAAELHRPGEEAQDRVHAAVVTREGTPASHMPDGVLVEQRRCCIAPSQRMGKPRRDAELRSPRQARRTRPPLAGSWTPRPPARSGRGERSAPTHAQR
jgi:hypothetical protein